MKKNIGNFVESLLIEDSEYDIKGLFNELLLEKITAKLKTMNEMEVTSNYLTKILKEDEEELESDVDVDTKLEDESDFEEEESNTTDSEVDIKIIDPPSVESAYLVVSFNLDTLEDYDLGETSEELLQKLAKEEISEDETLELAEDIIGEGDWVTEFDFNEDHLVEVDVDIATAFEVTVEENVSQLLVTLYENTVSILMVDNSDESTTHTDNDVEEPVMGDEEVDVEIEEV